MAATQRRPRQTVNSVEDLRQRLRQQSEFEAQTGWCQFYHAWRAELPRLCPGLSCRSLIDAVSSEINIQAAKAKKSGKQSSDWSPDLDKAALALECCTDKRTVDRDIKYLESSGMAQVRHSIRGTVSIRLMYRDWQNLPDYAPPDRPEPSPANQPETPKETFNLVKSPQPVKAGQFSERVKVACAVSFFRFQAAGAVDLAFTAVVKGGEFLVTSREVVSKRNAQGEEQAKAPSGISKLDVQSRHECLDGPKFSTGKSEEKATMTKRSLTIIRPLNLILTLQRPIVAADLLMAIKVTCLKPSQTLPRPLNLIPTLQRPITIEGLLIKHKETLPKLFLILLKPLKLILTLQSTITTVALSTTKHITFLKPSLTLIKFLK